MKRNEAVKIAEQGLYGGDMRKFRRLIKERRWGDAATMVLDKISGPNREVLADAIWSD